MWALWWAPTITLSDRSLVVHNAWMTHRIAWEQISHFRTRWCLVVELRDGHRVTASAAQRAGGITTSWKRMHDYQASGAEEKQGRPVTLAQGMTHRSVREDYITPGPQRYATTLDADAAADLIEAYSERRSVHKRLAVRQRRREQRMARHARTIKEPRGSQDEASRRVTELSVSASPEPMSTDDPASPSPQESSGVTSSWNRSPIVATAVFAVLAAASLL